MNNTIRLKVCGMRDHENILQVAELHPDYMGFIFYEKSKRFVGNEFQIPEQLDKGIKRVGVFVNESVATIIDLAKTHRLDVIQLHGDESVEDCKALKLAGLGVIKVFSVDSQFDFTKTTPYKTTVDFFLFDTKSETYGGTGRTFDWSLLHRYDQEIPFFLSGGLSTSNIRETKKYMKMNLYGFDVNSGVEIKPGLKSIDSIASLKTKIELL